MKWTNLEKNKCPRCSKELKWHPEPIIDCSCGFKISIQAMKRIVRDIVNDGLDEKFVDLGLGNE